MAEKQTNKTDKTETEIDVLEQARLARQNTQMTTATAQEIHGDVSTGVPSTSNS